MLVRRCCGAGSPHCVAAAEAAVPAAALSGGRTTNGRSSGISTGVEPARGVELVLYGGCQQCLTLTQRRCSQWFGVVNDTDPNLCHEFTLLAEDVRRFDAASTSGRQRRRAVAFTKSASQCLRGDVRYMTFEKGEDR